MFFFKGKPDFLTFQKVEGGSGPFDFFFGGGGCFWKGGWGRGTWGEVGGTGGLRRSAAHVCRPGEVSRRLHTGIYSYTVL